MAFFDSSALNPGVAKREVFGWAMYDFANSGYTTVVLTAVFNVYFIGVVAQGAGWGTLAWTLALSASNLLVLLLMHVFTGPESFFYLFLVTTQPRFTPSPFGGR